METEDGPSPEDKAEADKRAANRGCMWLFVAVVAVAAVWSLLAGDDTGGGDGPDDYAATDVCHQKVEDQLRAPATADFGGETVTHTGNRYTVVGHVDAQNGFGAQIRTDWVCEATWVSGTTWRPVIATLAE